MAVLAGICLVSALALSLALVVMTESMTVGAATLGQQALYGAEAGLGRALVDLRRLPDWECLLRGECLSGFTDGVPGGVRPIPGGGSVDLDALVNLANCGSPQPCTTASMDAVTAARPWGKDNPRWLLYAWGPLDALASAAEPALPTGSAWQYLVVMVADDPSEQDGNPARDSPPGSPGSGVILIRAESFGPRDTHRVLEATVARARPEGAATGYESQQGQGRSVGGAGRAAVQVPGAELSHVEWSLSGTRMP